MLSKPRIPARVPATRGANGQRSGRCRRIAAAYLVNALESHFLYNWQQLLESDGRQKRRGRQGAICSDRQVIVYTVRQGHE